MLSSDWHHSSADFHIFARRFYGMPPLLQTVQKKGGGTKPRRTLLYGTHGIGKSTFASKMPGHLIFDIEDGLEDIECSATPKIKSTEEALAWITELYTADHKYKIVAIDTLDFMERLIWQEICEKGGKDSIGDFGFGKGYAAAISRWQEILVGFDALREKRGIAILLLAHAATEKFENPETESYDRYAPRLHKGASQLIQQWCDEILFATHKVYTVTEDAKFGQERKRGVGGQERVIRTEERAAFVAKSRLDLPDEMPLDWDVYSKHMKGKKKNGGTTRV
jgi:hypothetical protein